MSSPDEIRIVCDNKTAAHPKKHPEVAVTAFRGIGDGRWTEVVKSTRARRDALARRGKVDSGTTLVGDEIYSRQVHGARPSVPVRSGYTLTCLKCGYGPIVMREGTMFAALNGLRHAGVSVVTMSQLAAIIQHMAGIGSPDTRE
jgi:hypothetical protein